MSHQPGNLFWLQVQDSKGQMIRVVPTTPTKPVVSTSSGGAPTQIKAILKATPIQGQEGARNPVLSNPQVIQTLALRSPKTTGQRAQVIAIPVGSSNANSVLRSSPSPLKTVDANLVPKDTTQNAVSSPIVLSTPQRMATPQRVTAVAQAATPPTPKNFISPILDHSGSRKRQEFDLDYSMESKRRKTDKLGKGLRHFSMKVCEKVQKKGTTSYNEVADELVAEFSDPSRCVSPTDQQYDQKNIRRRVYDALNVLMAMNIISKEKKEIKWLGLPTNSAQECQTLEMEKSKRIERINSKTQQLQDLILQQICFKKLVERNRNQERDVGSPAPNSAIQLPFIIVNTSKKTVIDCSISNDKMEYLFTFDDTFEIHDDIEVLKRMGMAMGLDQGQCTGADLEKAKNMVPRALESYVTQLALGEREPKLPNITPPNPDFMYADVYQDMQHAVSGLSRQSSITSLSDQARPDTATPSGGDYSEPEESDDDEDSDIDVQ